MLIKVHSSLLKAVPARWVSKDKTDARVVRPDVLSRLGRRWWKAVGFGADCEGEDALHGPGVCGELAYDDDEELAAALGLFS